MKVGLILPANRKVSPYVEYYIDLFEKNHIDYRLMIWDKLGINEKADMVYHFIADDFDRKRILMGHVGFARRCKTYIRREKLDCLVVFTIAPAFMLGRMLLKQYKGRFIFDIRDDSPFRRKFPIYLERLCLAASNIVVSSFAYAKWCTRDSVLCHNVNLSMLHAHLNDEAKQGFKSPVRIVYAGMMIEEDINLEVMRQLGKDPAYRLHYVGRSNVGKETLIQYAEQNNLSQVTFAGEYKKENIVGIYQQEADLINILRANTEVNANALPNKLYDAVLSGVPLVVFEHNRSIAQYVTRFHLGIVLQENDLAHLGTAIHSKMVCFDYCAYRDGRREFLTMVQQDMMHFGKVVLNQVKDIS